jgi:hypothetical protein
MKEPGGQGRKAALAFAPHSGWAALVALAGDARSPDVVLRQRIELIDGTLDGAAQPYHAAEGRPLVEAKRLIAAFQESAAALADQGLRAALETLRRQGCAPCAAGVLASSGREGASLEQILASHALIHTADGNHFRRALAEASRRCGIPASPAPLKTLLERASRALGQPGPALQARVQALKRQVGPPWTADHKAAALLAWALLAES